MTFWIAVAVSVVVIVLGFVFLPIELAWLICFVLVAVMIGYYRSATWHLR